MKSLWSKAEAKAIVDRYGAAGIGPDLALRVYTSRLLGGDPRLVLHGGGNTSVKTVLPDLLGEAVEVLCVKGSGWDLGNIEPAGLPAVRLDALKRLRGRDALIDQLAGHRVERTTDRDRRLPGHLPGLAEADRVRHLRQRVQPLALLDQHHRRHAARDAVLARVHALAEALAC